MSKGHTQGKESTMNVHTSRSERPMRPTAAALTILAVIALAWATTASASLPLRSSFAPAALSPTLISYQGFVKISGNPYTGTGYFKFAVTDVVSGNGTTNYWANDGTATGEPSGAVALAVTGGLFDVMLGDTSLAGMTQAITQNTFDQTATYLRVWFSQTAGGPFQALDPNQRIGSAAYALRAERAEVAADAEQLGGQSAATYQSRLTTLESGTPWGNLTGVPVGFADNIDNDTTYGAGSNLNVSGTTFALENDVSINTLTAASSVKVGGTNAACTAGTQGTVQWSSALSALTVCNGTSWNRINTGDRAAFRVRPSAAALNLSAGNYTAVIFSAEDFDDNAAFNSTTYVTPFGGLLHLDCRLQFGTNTAGTNLTAAIDRNGSIIAESTSWVNATGYYSRQVSADVKVYAGEAFRCLTRSSASPYDIYTGAVTSVGTVFSGYFLP